MQQMVEQTTQTNRCQTIWSLIQNKDLPPQMRARAAEPRQKHIPAGQPCRMKSPKERFHHKQQLTDSNWQDGWQEGSFLGFFPPLLSVNMSHHFCRGSLQYVFAWHKLMFMGNQTYCSLQSATGQVKTPVSSWQKTSEVKISSQRSAHWASL